MSYSIIKGLNTKDNKVNVKAACNNVFPRNYEWWECKSLTKILNEHGQTSLDLEILRQYESGSWQAGTPNKYSRAIEILRYMPEYEQYNWRKGGQAFKLMRYG